MAIKALKRLTKNVEDAQRGLNNINEALDGAESAAKANVYWQGKLADATLALHTALGTLSDAELTDIQNTKKAN